MLSEIFKAGAVLKIRNIITTVDQVVDRREGFRFSLAKWLNNIGRDPYYGGWSFGFYLGYYEVYEPFIIPAGSPFKMFELAVVNCDRTALLSLYDNMDNAVKIRIRMDQPGLQYIEVARHG